MNGSVSNAEMDYRRKLERYRIGINRSTAIDTNTAAGYFDWMSGELAQMEQEKKNTRVAARVRLRVRLKNLVVAILSQNRTAVKGASEHA